MVIAESRVPAPDGPAPRPTDQWAVAVEAFVWRPGGRGRRSASHPPRPGRYALSVEGPAPFSARRTLVVRPASRRLRVLATGDSMIQLIDGDLQHRLADRGRIAVHSDAHISTGISKPFMFDWVAHARSSSRALHPDVTVMFLAVRQGAVLQRRLGARVCAPARTMMRAYARHGAGTVYSLLLPTPRSTRFSRGLPAGH